MNNTTFSIARKNNSSFIMLGMLLLVGAMLVASSPCHSAAQTRAPGEVELLGVPLANATREQLRSALRKQNIGVVREKDNYWYDLYKAETLLDEADQLSIGYVAATGNFAEVMYRLPSTVDTAQVQRAISLISLKYGSPQSTNGSVSLGGMKATWQRGPMQIIVERGWPDTTTFIYLRHKANHAALRAEIDRQDVQDKRKAAEKQNRAF